MNLSTAIVLCVLLIVVALAIKSIRDDKKNGKSSCGGDCGGCGNSLCHHSTTLFDEYKKGELHK